MLLVRVTHPCPNIINYPPVTPRIVNNSAGIGKRGSVPVPAPTPSVPYKIFSIALSFAGSTSVESIVIFADDMDSQPAKHLEADLIRRAVYLQSVDNGLDVYKQFLSPVKLINKRQERSQSMFFNIHGEVMIWLELP